MASKKYLLLAAFITLFSTMGVKAQDGNTNMYRGGGYDFSDTSLIPEKRLPQQKDFLNNQYDFPAKPRNQWEIGISAGLLNVSGDVKSRTIFNKAIKPLNTLGFGLTVRKAWGYVISTRVQFIHGTASGYNYEAAAGYYGHGNANPWERAGYGGSAVYYNYKTTVNELSLQVVAAANNLKFHRARNKVSYYGLFGVGGMTYKNMVDALDGAGAKYNFSTVSAGLTGTAYENRKEITKRLKTEIFDGTYESDGEAHNNRGKLAGGTLRGMFTVGAGAQIRLSKMLSLQIEDKITSASDDLLDGQRWQEWPGTGGSAMTRDFDNVNYFSVGLNLNLGGKSTDPLWWMNPLDYSYNEMKRPKAPVSKCEQDADGDGISDCFDRCPNTPGGVSVDSHGCPFDTDGDNVPDYKDKQLITPTECQPVDADGVGKCPDPACCTDIKNKLASGELNPGVKDCPADYPSLTLKGVSLSADNKAMLATVAGKLKEKPTCNISLTAYPKADKRSQSLADKKLEAVKNYLVEKLGISEDRITTDKVIDGGDANTIDIKSN